MSSKILIGSILAAAYGFGAGTVVYLVVDKALTFREFHRVIQEAMGWDDDHLHEELRGLDVSSGGYQDAHELAHANDIRRRFANRHVTTGQIALFGLTGGLIPCPASITVLLICLQLKIMSSVFQSCMTLPLSFT